MDLSLSDEQEQLVGSFHAFFAKECPPTVVRASEETGGFDRGLWDAFGALGGPTMGTDASELVDMLGAEGLLAHGEAGAPVDGWVEHMYRHAAVTTIYGGTSEVQRGIIAERGLGLPRSRR